MKNWIHIIVTFFLALTCLGQDESVLKETGNSFQDIIPNDWRILDAKTGDLNQDGILDLVFAIQNTDKSNIKSSDIWGIDSVDFNPRILGVYFGVDSGGFKQEFTSNNFIILRDSPTMDEPFDGLEISEQGVLKIRFRFWYSAGSWSMSNHTYKFRFQDNEFVLIGYDSNEAHRASGETTSYSINFLTKKMKITKGNFSNDIPESIEWKKFLLEKPITIQRIDKPFELKFQGVYL